MVGRNLLGWGDVKEWRRANLLVTLRVLICAFRSAGSHNLQHLARAFSRDDDPITDSILDRFRRGLEPEGLQDAGLVKLRGPWRDVQQPRNFLGRTALRRQLQHFALAGSELVEGVRLAALPFPVSLQQVG